jgi:hypothetical protein
MKKYYLLDLACGILALIVVTSMGPINAYKDMLNNMVRPIDHIVMNHQNHIRTLGYKAMFATRASIRKLRREPTWTVAASHLYMQN